MSFGKAVVTSDFAFIGDILPPEGGLIYPSEDPNGLVRALREIQRMDIISMGKRNLERAQTLDWQSIATATTKVYYEILGNSASQETVTSGAYGHESS